MVSVSVPSIDYLCLEERKAALQQASCKCNLSKCPPRCWGVSVYFTWVAKSFILVRTGLAGWQWVIPLHHGYWSIARQNITCPGKCSLLTLDCRNNQGHTADWHMYVVTCRTEGNFSTNPLEVSYDSTAKISVVIFSAFELFQMYLCVLKQRTARILFSAICLMETCSLQMTNLLVTCAVKRVVCVLLGCVMQVQNIVTQAWTWKGEKQIKSICQMITVCRCLFEKTSLCFQKPPAVDQLCLKSMLSISETHL